LEALRQSSLKGLFYVQITERETSHQATSLDGDEGDADEEEQEDDYDDAMDDTENDEVTTK
jgi:hypothetical protein